MIRPKTRLLLSVILLCVGRSAFAQTQTIYTWTDSQGTVHFTDDPRQAPPDSKARAVGENDLPPLSAIEEGHLASAPALQAPPPARPSASSLPVGSVAGAAGEDYLVKPYLVYPADKSDVPAYERAVRDYLPRLQRWYFEKVGATFKMAPLQVVHSDRPYQEMRCGTSPTATCLADPKKLEGNWGMYMNRAIHHGVEHWDEHSVTLVFSAGGGGYAGSNLYPNDAGWSIVGDWVLEPLSGVANPWGIPCRYSDGWQCAGNVPPGTPAHEIGHAFGLPHPPESQPGKSIMRWHGDYPEVGFLPEELQRLRSSPFFRVHALEPSPK